MKSTASHISEKETFEEYHANGNIRLRYSGGIANDGRFLLDGIEEWFYPDGKIKYTAFYKLGKKTDPEKFFSSNGVLTWERRFQGNGFTWKQYWGNGNPKSESHWKNMKCEGEAKRWSLDGTLIKKVTFNKGHIFKSSN
jgi:antitoxin component YwqK of YwqJK toxin-antitoxin module